MPSQKRPVKRLLEEVIPKISAASTPVIIDLAIDNSERQSSNDVVTASSSMLKRHNEEVKKDRGTLSPDLTLPSRRPTLQVSGDQQTEDVRRTFIFYSPNQIM
jgi:hypothetical protein